MCPHLVNGSCVEVVSDIVAFAFGSTLPRWYSDGSVSLQHLLSPCLMGTFLFYFESHGVYISDFVVQRLLQLLNFVILVIKDIYKSEACVSLIICFQNNSRLGMTLILWFVKTYSKRRTMADGEAHPNDCIGLTIEKLYLFITSLPQFPLLFSSQSFFSPPLFSGTIYSSSVYFQQRAGFP